MLENAKIKELESEFSSCQKMLTAFGDEVRQKLLLLMITGNQKGVRVVDLAEKTDLTRPAVSHHMQILKDAGVVKRRKEGKCIFYYFDPTNKNIDALLRLFMDVKSIIRME